ncbi:MAG TPA: hypothetical protein DFH96_01950 [Bacteroidetes bacterium]|nr:hypothetical protein [Bacteroidota bacterium]
MTTKIAKRNWMFSLPRVNKLQLIWLFLFLSGIAMAETEPNDSKAQANVLTLNSGMPGTVTLTESDWFTVTIPEDGNLNIQGIFSSNIYIQIYDNDGVTSLFNNYHSGTLTRTVNGLAAGTYYIRLYNYYSSETNTYTLTATLTTTGLANDIEYNGTPATASVLALNGSTTGHVNYYYNNQKDTSDWYSVAVNQDGKLSYTITSNGQNVYAILYDGDATTQLAGSYTTATATFQRDGLAPGVYYIRIYTYYSSEYVAYTLSNILTPPVNANDPLPNDVYTQATTLPFNGSITGHIGFRYNGAIDTYDWYKVTTNADGKIQYTLTVDNGQHVYAELFDGDGTTFLEGSYTTTSATFEEDGQAPGTYYIRIRTFYSNQFASYQLSNNLVVPVQANDASPNDVYTSATVLNLNDSTTGHIGYRYNGNIDSYDWYSVTTNANGQLFWTITSHNGQNVYAELFDGDGTTNLAGSYTTTTATFNKNGLAPGTYYIRIRTFYSNEFSPYTLSNSLSPAVYTNDIEPNGSKPTALPLAVNTTVQGHIGFYYNNLDDTLDYYALTLPVDGKLSWTISSANGQNVYAQLYDNDGTTNLGGSYTTTSATFTENNLAAGTYYIKIRTFYISEFASYELSTSLDPMNFTVENTTDNDFAITPTLLPANTPTTGHLNFYYNNQYDNKDWWVIGYDGTGAMTITGELEQNHFDGDYPYINYALYTDTAASAIASGTWHNPTNSFMVNTPVIGKYFLRLTPGFSTFGAYRLTAGYTENCSNTITINSAVQAPPCLGTINYTVSNGLGNYTVQLYKNGIPFGTPQTTASTVSFNNLGIGTYYLQSSSFGASGACSANSANTVFSTPPVPNITAGGPTTFCQGGSVVLTADAANSYLWSTGATTQAITVSATGNYVVTVYNAALCSNTSASTSVTVNPLPPTPTITPNGPLTFCTNSNVTLSSSVANDYLWSTAEITQSIVVNLAGTYSVTISDANGCTATSASVTTNTIALQTFYLDADGDSYGDATNSIQDCAAPSGYVSNSTDCNDANNAIHPGATELCNGIDDDCNGLVDDNIVNSTYYADADGDGFGNPLVDSSACAPPIGYVLNNTDCNDANNAIYPGATEVCGNGIDDDCDGQIDEGCGSNTWYADADADTYGDLNNFVVDNNPTPPAGYVADSTDCDDNNAAVNPGATEICGNAIDDNCNGQVDENSPSAAIAGADTAVCSVNSTTLGATAPLVGSGSWSIVSGVGGSIAQPNNPNSTFSGQYNKPYVLEWTTSNGGCVFSDQVTVIFVNTNYSPGRIAGFSGQTSAVCGLTQTYAAIPNHPYATYSWSGYPAGTTVNLQSGNQITLTYPSSGFNYFQLKVTSTVCGVQTPIRSVAMKGAPSVKVANGPAIVCANATGIVYNVDLLAGVTYNWSVPQGATIVNGQGTNEITVDWGNSGGLVLCNIWNSCGSSTAKKSVTTNCRSAQQTLTESNSTLISIFPNPSSGVFNLHADNQLENVQITVTDLQGRTLINTLFTGNETTVDLSNYTQGVYMLQLHSNKEVQTYKLIKD